MVSVTHMTNEFGNHIEMGVEHTEIDDGKVVPGITVWASGPHSEVEHTWTVWEARELHVLLGEALGL